MIAMNNSPFVHMPDGTDLLLNPDSGVIRSAYRFKRPADAQAWINEHKAEYPGYALTVWTYRGNMKDVWIKISSSEPPDAEINEGI